MFASLLIFNVILALASSECPDATNKFIVCYYSSWSIYREDLGHFNTSHIDPFLCTHLVYTFAGLNLDLEVFPLDAANDVERGSYRSFTKLKETNPCLKTLLAVGGWNEGSRKYSVMAYTKESREKFADSVLRFLVTYNFDGFDIDWEYPTQRGGIDADRENFVELVKALNQKLKIWNLLLTIAVPISRETTLKAYDVAQLAQYVDYISVMAYDFTSGNSATTGLLSPLDAVYGIVELWLKDLPSSAKLVLGVPTYSRSFILKDANNNGIGAEVAGPGNPGLITREPGFLSYYELQAKLATKRYKIIRTSYGNYYAYYKSEWIAFDLEDTYVEKVDYAMEKNLGGVMVWTIDTDDFLGLYGDKPYTVLNIIRSRVTINHSGPTRVGFPSTSRQCRTYSTPEEDTWSTQRLNAWK